MYFYQIVFLLSSPPPSPSVPIGTGHRAGTTIGAAVRGGGLSWGHARTQRHIGGGVGPPLLHPPAATQQGAGAGPRYGTTNIFNT